MSFEISLSVGRNADGLFQEIKKGLEISEIDAQAELYNTNVRVLSENEQVIKVKDAVIEAISRFIIKQLEPQEIEKIVKSEYSFFTHDEKKQLLKDIEEILQGNGVDIAGSIFMIRRKNIITKRLWEYFENQDKLFIDGFLPFRLKDYLSELEEFVDRSADDFIMQKEYREFLGLLKFFVGMQVPKFAKINVIACDDGQYLLLDDDGERIQDPETIELSRELNAGKLNHEDMLISSLISISPSIIIIHNYSAGKTELLETLKHIFAGRISFCSNCDFCRLGTKGDKYLH